MCEHTQPKPVFDAPEVVAARVKRAADEGYNLPPKETLYAPNSGFHDPRAKPWWPVRSYRVAAS